MGERPWKSPATGADDPLHDPLADISAGETIDRRLLEAAVWGGSQSPRSDFDLNPGARGLIAPNRRLRPAAVLCAVAPRETGYQVILTRRADHLKNHAGQVAFPGGKIDQGDPSPMAAALREAEEEIGLAPDQVEILGAIDRYETVTGFAVTPFVGLCDPAFLPIADDGEVAEVFEAPLDFLMDSRNRQRRSAMRDGRERHFYAYDWQGKVIWGATAGMLKALGDRIAAARQDALDRDALDRDAVLRDILPPLDGSDV